MKYRYENFGGIISSEEPPFLAFVDREYMRGCKLPDSELWSNDESIGVLTAPTEVHFSCTNKCSAGCPHCYMDSAESDSGELNTADFKRALKKLADMGVFHVAMGGGEAFEREDFLELAAYAREVGLVPNLTTNGMHITGENVESLKVFGQANLSLDGLGENAALFRGKDFFPIVDRAVDILVDAGISTGFNTVVGRDNYDGLPELFEYAASKGINEIEILRLKPSGRAAELYDQMKTTYEQNVNLYPMLQELSEKTGVMAKVDCSFVPMMCYHRPPRELLEAMCTYGCEAGNVLLGARSNGKVSGCSFLPDTNLSIFDLDKEWKNNEEFNFYRRWADSAAEPCASCDYLDLCKGGCHAVAGHVYNDMSKPDPDCPFVDEYTRMHTDNTVL